MGAQHNLTVVAGGDITQNHGVRVGGVAEFSSGGNALTLSADNNRINQITVNGAVSTAHINNSQDLFINGITATGSVELDLGDNDIAQLPEAETETETETETAAAFNTPTLILYSSGNITLNHSQNSVDKIQGQVNQLLLNTVGSLVLGDLNVGDSATLSASSVFIGVEDQEQAPNIELSPNAQLTITIQQDAYVNANLIGEGENPTAQVSINASDTDNNVHISDALSWNNILFSFDLAEGEDTVTSNHVASTWAINSDAVVLTQSSRTLTLQSVETINAGTGDDVFNVQTRDRGITLNGGEGSDSIQAPEGQNRWLMGDSDTHQLVMQNADAEGPETVVNFTNVETLSGTASTTDTLVGSDSATAWVINSEEGGNVNGIDFNNINTLLGGAGADTFSIADSAANLSMTIDAGEAVDDNNSVIDTMVGFTDRDTRWLIRADGEQSINNIGLRNFERLEGAAEFNDTFEFEANADISVQIAGGDGGNDTLDYSKITEALDVRLGGNLNLVSGIEVLTGNGLAGSRLTIQDDLGLTGQALIDAQNDVQANHNSWVLNNSGTHTVVITRGDSENTLTFTGFDSLAGEAVADTFELASGIVLAQLDAGSQEGGINILQGPDIDITWTIDANDSVSTAIVNTVLNLDRIDGGSGNDTFVYASRTSAVGATGGEGTDTVNYAAVMEDVEVFLGESSESDQFGVRDVEEIIGNASEDYNARLVLLGAESARWQVTEINTGNVVIGEANPIQFSGVNQIQGGAGVDEITLQANLTGSASWVAGGDGNDIVNLQNILTLSISGESGDDHFVVNEGSRLTGTLDGGEGVDTLIGPDLDVTWQISNDTQPLVNLIQVDVEGGLINPMVLGALGVDALEGQSGDDTFSYQGLNSPIVARGGSQINQDSVDFSAVTQDIEILIGEGTQSAFSGVELYRGNAGIEGITATLALEQNQNSDWVIRPNGQGTATPVDGAPVRFIGFNTLLGSQGADTLNSTGLIPTGIRFDGRGGADTLSVRPPSAVTWVLDSALSLVGTDAELTTANALSFNNIETIQGSDGQVDRFIASSLQNLPSLSGGEGEGVEDLLDLSSSADFLSVDVNSLVAPGIERVIGNNNAQVVGPDGGANWLFDAGNVVQFPETDLPSFEGFNQAVGGSGSDHFTLNPRAGIRVINGAGGTNEVDASDYGADLTVGVGGTLQGALSLNNIQTISASAQWLNRIVSVANISQWQLEVENSGQLDYDESSIAFTGFNHLEGKQNNTFVLDKEVNLVVGTGPESATQGRLIGGEGTNELVLNHAESVTWELFADEAGFVEWGSTKIDFEGMETLHGGEGEDRFLLGHNTAFDWLDGGAGSNTLHGADTVNQWRITGDSSGAYNQESNNFERIQHVHGGAGTDSVVLETDARLTSLSTEGGDDLVTLIGDARLSGQIDGGTQTRETGDLLDLTRSTVERVGWGEGAELRIRQFEQIQAPSAGAQLLAPTDQENHWVIDGENAGLLNGIRFSGFDQLLGGAQVDTFTIAGAGLILNGINGAGGQDLVSLNESGAWRFQSSESITLEREIGDQALAAIESVVGGAGDDVYDFSQSTALLSGGIVDSGGDDRLIGPATNNQWNITTTNSGDLNGMGFEGIENLMGNSMRDVFVIADGALVSGLLDGSNPQIEAPLEQHDELDLTAWTSPFTVLFGDTPIDTVLPLFTIEGIETLSTTEGHEGQLQAGSGDNLWQITGVNSGTLNGTTFSNFTHLNGGTENDTFVLTPEGRLTGTVDGGAGENAFRIHADWSDPLLWQLEAPLTGSVRRVGGESVLAQFTHIQSIASGSGNDGLVVTAGGSLLEVDLGNGEDQVSLSNSPHQLVLHDDHVSITDDTDAAINVRSVEQINLGAGDDQLVLLDEQVNVFRIVDAGGYDRLDARVLTYVLDLDFALGQSTIAIAGSDQTLSFDGIEHWQVNPGLPNHISGSNVPTRVRFDDFDHGVATHGEDNTQVLWAFDGVSRISLAQQDDAFELNGYMPIALDGGSGVNSVVSNASESQTLSWTFGVQDTPDSVRLESDNEEVTILNGITRFMGGEGEDHFSFEASPITPVSLDGLGGDDRLTFSPRGFDWMVGHSAGETANEIRAKTTEEALVSFDGIEQLTAAGDADLFNRGEQLEWRFDDYGQGQLQWSESDSVDFSGFVNFWGGSGNDTFYISEVADIPGFLDGGDGLDRVRIEDQPVDAQGESLRLFVLMDRNEDVNSIGESLPSLWVANMEALESTAENSYLVHTSTAEAFVAWSIQGPGVGDIQSSEREAPVHFEGFDHLLGGDGNDSFSVVSAELVTTIAGGGGEDLIDYSTSPNAFSLSVSASNEEGITGVEGVKGNGLSELVGSDAPSQWILTSPVEDIDQPIEDSVIELSDLLDGVNDGIYRQLNAQGEVVETVKFWNFSQLTGGADDDEFIAQPGSRISGLISGGDHVGGDQFHAAIDWPEDRVFHAAFVADFEGSIENGIPPNVYRLGEMERLVGEGRESHLWSRDSDNVWAMQGRDAGVLRSSDQELLFSQVANLHGGAGVDRFELSADDQITGWISAGAGQDQLILSNQSPHAQLLLAEQISVNEGTEGFLIANVLNDFEHIQADTDADSVLMVHSAEHVDWALTGDGVGQVLGTTFEQFAVLQGSASNDTFTAEADSSYSGIIDGGRGENTLDLTRLPSAVTISLRDDAADFNLRQVQVIRAPPIANANNQLWGPNDKMSWVITGLNQGDGTYEDLAEPGVEFYNIHSLRGGNRDDHFRFAEEGEFSGLVEGGPHDTGDVLNYSSVQTRRVVLKAETQFDQIEHIIGGAQTHLEGPDLVGESVLWRLDSDQRRGQLSYESTELSFDEISVLQGGAANDRFELDSASKFRDLRGGEGNDTFIVNIESTSNNRQFDVYGEAGDDRVIFTGGANSFDGGYQTEPPNAEGEELNRATLTFTEAQNNSRLEQNWTYHDAETVDLQSELGTLTIHATQADDTFVLEGRQNNQTFLTINQQAPLILSQDQSQLSLAANATDDIVLAGEISLNGELTLRNGHIVTSTESGKLSVGTLILDGVQAVGSEVAPLATRLSVLGVENGVQAIYLREENGLNLSQIDTLGSLNLSTRQGNIGQLPDTSVTADQMSLVADNGSILLGNGSNRIGGRLNLQASSRVDVVNQIDTTLGRVIAETLSLDIDGDVMSVDALGVDVSGMTTLKAVGTVDLSGDDHDFGSVKVEAQQASITDINDLTLLNTEVNESLAIAAQNLTVSEVVQAGALTMQADSRVALAAPIRADELRLEANAADVGAPLDARTLTAQIQGDLLIRAPMTITDSSMVNADTITVNEAVLAGSVSADWTAWSGDLLLGSMFEGGATALSALQGNMSLSENARLDSAELAIEAQTLNLRGAVDSKSLNLKAAETFSLSQTVEAREGDIAIHANTVQMDSGSELIARQGKLNILSQGDLNLASLGAGQDIQIQSTAGHVLLAGGVVSEGRVVVEAFRDLSVRNRVDATGDMRLFANLASEDRSDLSIQGELTSQLGSIYVEAFDTPIVMSPAARMTSPSGAILLTGGDMRLSSIQAGGQPEWANQKLPQVVGQFGLTGKSEVKIGGIEIVSSGRVDDHAGNVNGQFNNASLRAYALDIQAENGVGRSDAPLDVEIDSIYASSKTGGVYINNRGSLSVRGLIAKGDIQLNSSSDVYVTNGSINALMDLNRPLGSSENGGGNFQLEIPNPPGSLVMQGVPQGNNPAISANSVTLLTRGGDFAELGLPPSVYAIDSFLVIAARSWAKPVWGYGRQPKSFTDQSTIQTNINDVGAGEQLVLVETLEEIDPAVFSPVRNYHFEDISILLPRDQRYEDETVREEKETQRSVLGL